RKEPAFFAAAAAAALLAMIAGGPFAWAARLLPGLATIFLSRLRLVALFGAAALASRGASVLAARLTSHRLRLAALPALLLFTTLDLSLAALRFDPFPDAPDAPPRPTPALQRLFELAPGDGHRFLAFGTALVPNVAFESGLEDVRAHQLFTAGYRSFLSAL